MTKNKQINFTRIIDNTPTSLPLDSEYHKNADFNEQLDSGEWQQYELILKKSDGEEQQIEPISKALFTIDKATYSSIKNEFTDTQKHKILNLDEYKNNYNAYDKLLSILKKQATIIPFIGAGFSVAANCPTWKDYIISQAQKARINIEEVSKELEKGNQEQVMNTVITKQTLPVFKRDFRDAFDNSKISPSLSPAYELLGLLDNSMITINFDRVIEKCHEEKMGFSEKVVGAENNGRFLKSIFNGEKYLLKLHGNIDNQEHRVLTKKEYNKAYGTHKINYDLPIPRTLMRIFKNFTTLFLGCSLLGDRYMTILKEIYSKESQYIPEHFAILPAPEDDENLHQRDKFLAAHGITPIWFSEGQWDTPAEILKLLKTEIY